MEKGYLRKYRKAFYGDTQCPSRFILRKVSYSVHGTYLPCNLRLSAYTLHLVEIIHMLGLRTGSLIWEKVVLQANMKDEITSPS